MAYGPCFLLVLVLFLPPTLEAGRILLVPIPSGSHAMNFQQVGEALLSAGHDVHIVTESSCTGTAKLEKTNMKLHTYDTGCLIDSPEMEAKREAVLFSEIGLLAVLSVVNALKEVSKNYTETIFMNETLFAELRSYKFDMCIVDGLAMFRFLYLIPYKLDIPIASFLAVFNPVDARIPALPSFTPMINFGKFTDDMSFGQRVINTLQMFFLNELMTFTDPHLSGQWVVSEFAPEKPPTTVADIVSSTELWLIQNDVTLDYPQVRLPHAVDIGGLNTRAANPLPDDLRAIMDGATEGAVIVSFGSMVRSFPPHISRRLLNDLARLKQVVIWRQSGTNPPDVPRHVHLFEWLPQSDLLGHPNTKVFVTHCGSNGQFEALYNAVPMVGLPLFADQIYNARRIHKHGMGIHLNLFEFEPGELLSAIEEVVSNDSYRNNMARRSQIFHDRPMTPKETLVFWVEHVLKYGSAHLRSIAITMPWYKYWSVDILICFLVALHSIAFVWYKATCCIVRMICKRAPYKKYASVKTEGKEKRQ